MKRIYYSTKGIIRKPKSKKKRIQRKFAKKVICIQLGCAVSDIDTAKYHIGDYIFETNYDETLKEFLKLENDN